MNENTYTREEIMSMTPQEINKNWESIKEWLAKGEKKHENPEGN